MITGKDIHVAAEKVSLPAGHMIYDWDALPELARMLYGQVAESLNAAHVEPLQALVSDMQMFIEEQCCWPDTPETHERAIELHKRAKALVPKKGIPS